jgi:hypothetical protein
VSAATPCLRLGTFAGGALEAAFDGVKLTSNGADSRLVFLLSH